MRLPVFARGTNPAIDRPILHKSSSYVEMEIAAGRAHWVNCANRKLGIIAIELLYFGPPRDTEPERSCSFRGGLVKFILPDAIRKRRAESRVLMVRQIFH